MVSFIFLNRRIFPPRLERSCGSCGNDELTEVVDFFHRQPAFLEEQERDGANFQAEWHTTPKLV